MQYHQHSTFRKDLRSGNWIIVGVCGTPLSLSLSLSTDPLNEGILLWVVLCCFICSALTLRHRQNIGVYHGYVTTLCSLCSVDACDPQPTARIRPPGSKLHMPPGSSKSHCWYVMKKEHEKQRHFDTVWRNVRTCGCHDFSLPELIKREILLTWEQLQPTSGLFFLLLSLLQATNSLAIPLPQLCHYTMWATLTRLTW